MNLVGLDEAHLDTFILSCIRKNKHTSALLDYYSLKQKRKQKMQMLESEIANEVLGHVNFNGTGNFKEFKEEEDKNNHKSNKSFEVIKSRELSRKNSTNIVKLKDLSRSNSLHNKVKDLSRNNSNSLQSNNKTLESKVETKKSVHDLAKR